MPKTYQYYLPISFILVAGISLFIIALPRFTASINHIPVNNFFSSLSDEDQIPKLVKIPHYIESSLTSISQHENAKYWEDLANLWLHQAQIQGSLGKQNDTFLFNAENASYKSLSLSPGNSFLLFQLAKIHALQKKTRSKIVNLLLLSIMSSPNEPGFIIHRLDFCLMYFSVFKQQDYPYLIDQLILLWGSAQREFLQLLHNRNDYLEIITLLFKDKHPELLNEILTTVKNV